MKKLFLILALVLSTSQVFASVSITKTYDLEKIYHVVIAEICNEFKIDINLVKAVIRIESAFNRYAIGPGGASKGLMQLTKGTARRFGVKDVFCPKQNITGGVRYLKYLEKMFRGNFVKILAAYNMGEAKVLNRSAIPTKGFEYAKLVLDIKYKYDERDKKCQDC